MQPWPPVARIANAHRPAYDREDGSQENELHMYDENALGAFSPTPGVMEKNHVRLSHRCVLK